MRLGLWQVRLASQCLVSRKPCVKSGVVSTWCCPWFSICPVNHWASVRVLRFLSPLCYCFALPFPVLEIAHRASPIPETLYHRVMASDPHWSLFKVLTSGKQPSESKGCYTSVRSPNHRSEMSEKLHLHRTGKVVFLAVSHWQLQEPRGNLERTGLSIARILQGALNSHTSVSQGDTRNSAHRHQWTTVYAGRIVLFVASWPPRCEMFPLSLVKTIILKLTFHLTVMDTAPVVFLPLLLFQHTFLNFSAVSVFPEFGHLQLIRLLT